MIKEKDSFNTTSGCLDLDSGIKNLNNNHLLLIWSRFSSCMLGCSKISIAFRIPMLSENGRHRAEYKYVEVQESVFANVGDIKRRLVGFLNTIYRHQIQKRWPGWSLTENNIGILFNLKNRDNNETILGMFISALREYGRKEVAIPLLDHPHVRMVLSVIIDKRIFPVIPYQIRLENCAEALVLRRLILDKSIHFTRPKGEPLPGPKQNPCIVCGHDLGKINGIVLPCNCKIVMHADCANQYIENVPSCQKCGICYDQPLVESIKGPCLILLTEFAIASNTKRRIKSTQMLFCAPQNDKVLIYYDGDSIPTVIEQNAIPYTVNYVFPPKSEDLTRLTIENINSCSPKGILSALGSLILNRFTHIG